MSKTGQKLNHEKDEGPMQSRDFGAEGETVSGFFLLSILIFYRGLYKLEMQTSAGNASIRLAMGEIPLYNICVSSYIFLIKGE